MGWERILKSGGGGHPRVSKSDRRLVNYILRDGEFKTIDRIMDEVYDLLQENKKLGHGKVAWMRGRPKSRRFAAGKREVKMFMTNSPDYESRDTGNKNLVGTTIKEYRYLGE